MKLAVLFTGGKDSCYALYRAMEKEEVVCLISIMSENRESYMYHTPNIELTELQAEAIGLPVIVKKTKGIKEKELRELKSAIAEAKEKYHIRGIVTGAVESVYQAVRIQKICSELGLWCFNPLWQKDQVELLKETVNLGFETIISGVYAFPLTKEWLGRKINSRMIKELEKLQEKYGINPAGEGGELETTVLNAPFFKKRIIIRSSSKNFSRHAGGMTVKKAVLEK